MSATILLIRVSLAVLVAVALYGFLGLSIRRCSICRQPVRDRHAFPWSGPDGPAYTHLGACSDEYRARHYGNEYRAGEGP